MTLFDDFERSDPRPAKYGEDSFAFFNRADGRFWSRVRDELEVWFSSYPSDEAADLRARFRSDDPRQHHAAWWELYLHRLFACAGWSIEVHPDVAGSTHPDFRLTRGTDAFYLEALTVFSGIVEEGRNGTREAWVLDLINEVPNRSFFVGVDFEAVGLQRPNRQEVVRPTKEWLETLDPDAVALALEKGEEPPELTLRFRDWEVVVEAFPVRPDARDKPDHRLVGLGPVSGGWVNDIEQVQRGLGRKFRRYGELDDPFVVAVLGMSSFLERTDVEQALYGRHALQYETEPPYATTWIRRRDGLWMGSQGPCRRSVSAVISASGLQPVTAARQLPHLWLNPWAERPFTVDLQFGVTSCSDTGELVDAEASTTPQELLGLPEAWPGPEDPFG
jgi:hypothetical protein